MKFKKILDCQYTSWRENKSMTAQASYNLKELKEKKKPLKKNKDYKVAIKSYLRHVKKNIIRTAGGQL